MSLLKEFPLCLLSPQEPKMREKVLKYIYFTTFKDKPRPSASFGWWGRDNCFFWKRNDVKHEKLDKDIQLLKKKKKKHRKSNFRAAWQDWPHAMVYPPFPRHFFPHGGGHSPGISLLLFSHRVQPPHSHLRCKTQDFPCSLFPLRAFLLASPSPVALEPWFIFPRGSSTPWPSPGPCSGLSPTTWETLEPTTSSAETMPGVVYWLGSSILSLHNYGFSMQERGKKKIAALVCYGLKLQLFA